MSSLPAASSSAGGTACLLLCWNSTAAARQSGSAHCEAVPCLQRGCTCQMLGRGAWLLLQLHIVTTVNTANTANTAVP